MNKLLRPRYYVRSATRGPLERAWRRWILHQLPVPRFPRHIQIQTITGCNARCIFCPNDKVSKSLPGGTMEWDLFRKIVDECLHSGIERISPYLMNEPLLDRDLPRKIRYVSDNKNERSYTKVNTNASLLTEEMGRELIQAKLDRLNVSFHGIRRTTYEASMVGLNYEDVLQKVNSFIETKQRLNAEKPRLRITMVRTKIIDGEIDEILAYWGKRGIKVNIRGLENRTNAEISSQGMFVEKWMPFRWCNRMMEQAYVLFNGDVILCCVDWERTTVLGNLRRNSLAEIWNGAAYTEVRRRFLAGDLKDMLCRKCLKEPDYT